ncbi:MAG TPA: ABC transporter ATP-binding protein, partial [Daejeonella sp.]|nr:ABC transporter ATP-binding protein [Daejeonella sp.]
MKLYFRLLSFAKPIEKFAIPYFIVTILHIFFNTINFSLLAPLLNTLFSEESASTVVKTPDKDFSLFNIIKVFDYYVHYFIETLGKWETLKYVCIAILISVFLANLFKYFSQRIMENLRIHTLKSFRKRVFDNVVDLHIGFFTNERKGDIISKISTDVQTVQYSVTNTLQVIFKEPFQIIFYLILLITISPKLTLYAFLFVPLAGFFIARLVKRLRKQATAAQSTFGDMVSFLDEVLTGIKIVKVFNASEYAKGKFNDQNNKYSRIIKSMANRQQAASPVSEFLGVTMVVFIVLYGGYLIINSRSELKPAEFITYIAVFSQIMRPVKAITDSFSNIHQGIAAGERVLELIDTKPQVIDVDGARVINNINEGIKFNNVSFSYDKKLILNQVNFEIPVGYTVALVGPSGSGKSTIADLTARFYDVSEGEILIDGINIKNIQITSLRRQLGMVGQESILFNDTVFNNIVFGKANITEEQVKYAAKIANAHSFIENLDHGYQTNIGDRGMKLSGGQRQRLSIARAVLHNP